MKKGSHHSLEAKEKLRIINLGKNQNEETKLKRSISLKGNKNSLGKKHSEEWKQKARDRYKGENNPMYGIPSPMTGKHHSLEVREKIRQGKMGKNNPSFGKIGEKSYRWNGGTSFLPYDLNWNRQFKESIKERDGCCMLCNTKFPETLVFHIHHIDYNKENTTKENCITLCHSCHSKTNTHREDWKLKFYDILSKDYGYEYRGLECS
jgi:5-methylcytosine-specific restriction endonuclease McrA